MMQAIKLWTIDEGQSMAKAIEVESVRKTDTESMLEDILTRSPELLMPGLKLIGRQTATAGGPLDLLGVDSDGYIVVFELKRGDLGRDSVAQIVDYASYLTEMDVDLFCEHIANQSGRMGIEKITDFREWYQENFDGDFDEVGKPRMVLVGLGVDDRTRRMVYFLADSDIDVSLITFHAFREDGKLMLARQVEVEAKSSPVNSKERRRESLQKNVRELGVEELFFKVANDLRTSFSQASQKMRQYAVAYRLPTRTESGNSSPRAYVSLYLPDEHGGPVRVRIRSLAVEVAPEAADKLRKALTEQTEVHGSGNMTISVGSDEDWETIKPEVDDLLVAVEEGWQTRFEQEDQEDIEEVMEATGDGAAMSDSQQTSS